MKFVLVGGFLGSGKTTAIVAASQLLKQSQKKVAIITNDQGDQQVDGAFVKALGISTREVSNGCFCCNYNELDAHIDSFQYENNPDIIFAESVGTCTDLIATVVKPLTDLRKNVEVVISIFADADLLCSVFEGRSSFVEESVRYIYKKQLEEADVLIINKTDLLTPQQIAYVESHVKAEYPSKEILLQNSLQEESVGNWLTLLSTFIKTKRRDSLAIDYKIYGDGESKLAWLDKSITIITTQGNAVDVVSRIIGSIFDRIQSSYYIIGHLKFLVETEHGTEKISFTTSSTSADVKLNKHETNFVKLLINARVETNPDALEKIVDSVLFQAEQQFACTIANYKWSVFKPGYPRPVHRIEI
jgi:G3E family GTPase